MIHTPSRTLSLLSLLALASTVAAQGDAHDLRTTAKKGASAYFVHATKQEQNIDLGGQTMEMGNTVNYTVRVSVSDVDDKGELSVTLDILRIEGFLILPMMGEVEFDSAGKPMADDGMGTAQLGAAMTSLAGKTFFAKVSPFGKVSGLEGADKILADARKKGGQMGAQMLTAALSDKSLEALVENSFGPLPEAPLAIGKSWSRVDSDKASRAPVENKTDLTLTQFGADSFELDAKGTVNSKKAEQPEQGGADEDPNAAMAREMMAKMKVSNGKIAGKIKISRTDGFSVESSSVVTMDLEMPSPMGGDMLIAMKTTLSTKRTTAEAAKPKTSAEEEPVKK